MYMRGQSGAVSLFVVMFATLLLTVVTVSFLRIMVNDQTQASNSDLSQSAYDSAQAGVEDAKRVLLRYQKVCATNASQCLTLGSQISTTECNAALLIGSVVNSGNEGTSGNARKGEIRVQQSSGDSASALDQAYTCVTIALDTDGYVGTVGKGESKLIPLIGASQFTDVVVKWFSNEDIGSSSNGAVSLEGISAGKVLYPTASWPNNRPSVMRTQLMQVGSSFTLQSFDYTTTSGQSNTNTIFLYPTTNGAPGYSFIGRDIRKEGATGVTPADDPLLTPVPAQCTATVSDGRYACSTILTLPTAVGEASGSTNRTAYLRLSPYYNATNFEVSLLNNGSPVKFRGVQPEIDSTGRANDMFRRVVTRVDLVDTSFPYPDAALDVTGNLCKDFGVTNNRYVAGNCTP